MSEAARNFVSTCLTVDPEARPAAVQMLQHSWLVAEVSHFVEATNNADLQDGAALHHNAIAEGTEFSRREVSTAQGSATT